MADEKLIWVEIDEDRILQRFDFFVAYHRQYVHNMLDDVANFGVRRLHAGVPQYTSYILRHVDRSPVHWTPEGYQAIVGIRTGTSRHALYAEKGTGIYATPPRGFIESTRQEYMSFFSTLYGRRIRIRRVKGQKPQRFFYAAWRDLEIYARARFVAQNILP